MSYRESRGSFATAAAAKRSTYGSDFVRLSKATANSIQKIRTNVHHMKTMLNDLEKKPDDTFKLSRLHEVQQKTNNMVKDTKKYIENLNNIPKSSNVAEQRQQKIQTERLVNEFSKALDDFREIQKKEREKTKTQVVRDRKSIKQMQDFHSSSKTQETMIIGQKEQLTIQADISDVEIELMQEREEALRKLEADIVDVNQIFQDLAAMIHEQGEVIDTIESNVESAAVNVEEGKQQLQKAHSSAISARKKKLIIIVVVVVVIVVILVIILASVLSNKK